MTTLGTNDDIQLAEDHLKSKPVYWTVIISIFVMVVSIGIVAILMSVIQPGSLRYRGAADSTARLPEIGTIETRQFGQPMRSQLLQQRASSELESFGWVNEEQGIIRVPIEDAMRWTAETQKEETP